MRNHPHRANGGDIVLTRRRWLGATAAAAVAIGPLGASAIKGADPSSPWRMRLSTSSLHYRGLPLADALRRIGALGFAGVDVWAHFEWAGPLCEHLEEGLDKLGPEKFAALLKENKLTLFSASCYGAPFAQFASQLGRMGGCVAIRGSAGFDPAGNLAGQMKKFFESLKPELDLAEKHQCTLAIENHSGDTLLNKLDSLKAFTDLNQNDRLGIALAPYHIQWNQESVEQAIRTCGSQLKFFYAWQHAEGTSQLPGIGPADMRPWLQALADIGYQGYVNPFMHHEPPPDEMDAALARSRDSLRAAYAELSR